MINVDDIKTVLIVEDHTDARNVLIDVTQDLLQSARVVGARTLAEARTLMEQDQFDLALIDIGLPDGSGLSLITETRETIVSVVTTVFDDDDNLFAALRAGAVGYLLKGYTKAELRRYLMDLMEGKLALSPSIALRVLDYFRTAPASTESDPAAVDSKELTEREIDILRLVAKGYQTKEVASILEISANTVSHHIKSIYTKLNIHNRAQATSAAAELKLL